MIKINNLKDARLHLGKSQKEVAKATGMHVASICYYECLLRFPRPDIALIIIEYYKKHGINISFEDIYKHHADHRLSKAKAKASKC